MNRLLEETKVIPRAAWVIAVCLPLVVAACAWLFIIPRDEDFSYWPRWGLAFFVIVMPLFLAVYVLLIGYVNGDARRRGMRHVLWTLLAMFIPNAIGFILYFMLRDPLLRGCPNCGTSGPAGFAFCPKCGTELAQACPQCRSAVQLDWSHCAKCGTPLRPA